MSNMICKMKEIAIEAALEKAVSYLSKDPEENIPKVMDLVDRVVPKGWYEG